MSEYICGICKDVGYILKDSKMIMCDCFKKKIAYEEPRIALQKMNIDPSFQTYDIKTFVGTKSYNLVKRVEKFVAGIDEKYRGISLYFYSRANGTQKSTLAQYALRELAKKGKSGYMITMGKLLPLLTDGSFENLERRERDRALVETIKSRDVLVIDDAFDKKKATIYKSDYQLAYLDTFLREFIETNKKSVIFTSNVSVRRIGEEFSESIGALISRNAFVMKFLDVYDINSFGVGEIFDD